MTDQFKTTETDDGYISNEKECGTCGGTGWQILSNSWFGKDWRRERCGICAGTGQSSYRDNPDFVRSQARRRAELALKSRAVT